MAVKAIVLVKLPGASSRPVAKGRAPWTDNTEITRHGQPPNTIVKIQEPGMEVQPVVLVDQNGNYISPSPPRPAWRP